MSPTLPPLDAEFVARARQTMKACQRGVGGRDALENAHSLLADCYGVIGRLLAHASLDGATPDPEEAAALERFRGRFLEGVVTTAQAARIARREYLISIGELPLPQSNRSQGARRHAR